MLNQAALEALYSATYVDNFLDTIENLPDEVQRQISSIRELDIRYQALLEDLENLRAQYSRETDSHAMKKVMVNLQDKLILSQEIGDEKLQIAQHILDIIDNRQRQLDLDCKNLDLEQEEKAEVGKEISLERSSKRPRRSKADTTTHHHHHHQQHQQQPENSSELPTTPLAEKATVTRSVNNRSSSQKRSSKKKKRKSRTEREREDSPAEISIDPNEPTYCLCEQVSYGEMIGCDNDLCPIEWFHFSCVNLTNKPKGKWFCPKCRGDKATVMKPRAQFLKELQKYNKEKEERS